jgi:hypothetical protein
MYVGFGKNTMFLTDNLNEVVSFDNYIYICIKVYFICARKLEERSFMTLEHYTEFHNMVNDMEDMTIVDIDITLCRPTSFVFDNDKVKRLIRSND